MVQTRSKTLKALAKTKTTSINPNPLVEITPPLNLPSHKLELDKKIVGLINLIENGDLYGNALQEICEDAPDNVLEFIMEYTFKLLSIDNSVPDNVLELMMEYTSKLLSIHNSDGLSIQMDENGKTHMDELGNYKENQNIDTEVRRQMEIHAVNLSDKQCQGCLEDQPNQMAHIGNNGCLGEEF